MEYGQTEQGTACTLAGRGQQWTCNIGKSLYETSNESLLLAEKQGCAIYVVSLTYQRRQDSSAFTAWLTAGQMANPDAV